MIKPISKRRKIYNKRPTKKRDGSKRTTKKRAKRTAKKRSKRTTKKSKRTTEKGGGSKRRQSGGILGVGGVGIQGRFGGRGVAGRAWSGVQGGYDEGHTDPLPGPSLPAPPVNAFAGHDHTASETLQVRPHFGGGHVVTISDGFRIMYGVIEFVNPDGSVDVEWAHPDGSVDVEEWPDLPTVNVPINLLTDLGHEDDDEDEEM